MKKFFTYFKMFDHIMYHSAIILIMFFLPLLLKADIVHKEVNITLQATVDEIMSEYNIDMDNDSQIDFFLNHGLQGPDTVCEIYSGSTHPGNEILAISGRNPVILEAGDLISGSLTGWVDSYTGMSSNALYFEKEWFGAQGKFTAVRFKINNEYHYGWIRISIPADKSFIKIVDYAYEDTSGEQITAGDTGTGIDDEDTNKIPFVSVMGRNIIISRPVGITGNITTELYNIGGNMIAKFISCDDYEVFLCGNIPQGIYFIKVAAGNKTFIKKIALFR